MSEVKHFHKKEAARILIELRNKTEDERLMDYRRQLLQNDGGVEQSQSFNEYQDRFEQNLWPWAYPNPSSLPFNPNALQFGYPCVPNTSLWFPPTACIETSPPRYNLAPSIQGIDFQHTFPWPQLTATHHQGFIDAGNASRRRRTKFTNEQLAILEKTFTHGSKFPSPGERMRLETRTGLSKEKISVWFQNRRAKEKREKSQEENSKETEESTTDSENETEDEIQLHVCDETPEEESETENKVNHSNEVTSVTQPVAFDEMKHNVGEKRSHAISSLSFANSKEKTNESYSPYLENQSKTSDNEISSDGNEHSFSDVCDVNESGVVKTLLNVIDVTKDHDDNESKREDPRFQNKRMKFFHTGSNDINTQSYACLENRLFGET